MLEKKLKMQKTENSMTKNDQEESVPKMKKTSKRKKLEEQNESQEKKAKSTQQLDDEIACDLILNVAAIPIKTKEEKAEIELKERQNANQKNSRVPENGSNVENTVVFNERPIGTPHISSRENKKVPGGVQLGFQLANLKKVPNYGRKDGNVAKKSYQHLIVGDITIGFNNCNLNEIVGYGVQ